MDPRTLRRLIRLAYAAPDLRMHLLPLLREGMAGDAKVRAAKRVARRWVERHPTATAES